jgi:hypothetical protein
MWNSRATCSRPLHLGRGVEHEVGVEVAAGGDERTAPRHAVAVGGVAAAAVDDGVLRVAVRPAGAQGVALGVVLRQRSRVLQPVDHRGDHLDMGELLGADVEQHVLVLAGQPAVPALVEVLHGDGHLAPLAAQHFLEAAGEGGVGPVGLCLELQLVHVREHLVVPSEGVLWHSAGTRGRWPRRASE